MSTAYQRCVPLCPQNALGVLGSPDESGSSSADSGGAGPGLGVATICPSMRRGTLLGVAGLLAVTLLACGRSSSGASTSRQARTSPTAVAAQELSPATVSPTQLASAPVKDRILVRPLGIDASFSETSCADATLPTVVPAGATIIYADCGNYWRFVASDAGPLAALLSAPAGTPLEWVNGAGVHNTRVMTGAVMTVARETSSGQFPGHGVPPGPSLVFIQLRNGSQQTELTAR